jgi:hypothetical protein
MLRRDKLPVAAHCEFGNAVLRLAALPIPEYRERRCGEAEGLGVRRRDLDKAVAERRRFIRAIDDTFDGSLLVRDIASIFRQINPKQLSTKSIIRNISKVQDRPWSGMLDIDQNAAAIARLLRPLHVRPKPIRFKDEIARGYTRQCFEKALRRLQVSAGGPRLS